MAENTQWRIRAKGRITRLQQALGQLPFKYPEALDPIAAAGIDIAVDASGSAGQVKQVSWRVTSGKLDYASEDGAVLGDSLGVDWRGKATANNGRWQGYQAIRIKSGELLVPWGYLDARVHPLSLETRFMYLPKASRARLSDLNLALKDILAIQGGVVLDTGPENAIHSLELNTTTPVDLARLYQDLLSPVLVETPWEHARVSGKLDAKLKWSQGVFNTLSFHLQDATFSQSGEERERLRIEGLRASGIFENGSGQARLGWGSGELFGTLELGSLDLDLRVQDQRIVLVKDTELPILDGALRIEELDFSRVGGANELLFKGYLEPISLGQLTQALDWPKMSGKVSAMIPRARYHQGRLEISGASLVRAFDGSLVIRDLVMDDPLGDYPVLSASLSLKKIDLEQLTETFAFGRITGRLEGQVNDLRLEQWKPIAFDAWLATPEDDDSRHRISQRAVENLSNLGGSGVSGALSRGFMRFFNEFGYSRLGIRCRLKGQTCFMDGVEPAENGYYLVKGGGLPRVDIVGFNRETDWDLLVSKLKEMTEGGTSVEIR